MKNYIYSIEKHASKYLTVDDLNVVKDIGIIHILCYNVNESLQYPFIQFLLDKTPNVIREELILPSIIVTQNTHNIETLAIQRVKSKLESICINCDNISDPYVGVVTIDGVIFMLFELNNVTINGAKIGANTPSLFVLPNEIINVGTVYDINVNKYVRNLFLRIPELGMLNKNDKHHDPYPLPDVVYCNNNSKSEFECAVGVLKRQWVPHCAPYYGFCKNFQNGYSLRCALFSDNCSFYVEDNDILTLTDDEINRYHNGCDIIYIYYSLSKEKQSSSNNIDILVIRDSLFTPLSCLA